MRLIGVLPIPHILCVSIHAPWEGCDSDDLTDIVADTHVSIHAPWEGCDQHQHQPNSFPPGFQFTHPGKGATLPVYQYNGRSRVSIHAPWEGCDGGDSLLV